MATVSSSEDSRSQKLTFLVADTWLRTPCRGPVLTGHTWFQPLSYSSMLLIGNLCFHSGICFPCNHELKKEKKKAVYLMNGLICFLGNIFKNNVLQRLPFTWGVSTQSLGSSWLGALKFWNLNILSHCPFWLLTLVFSSLSQFLSFSFLTLFSLCILFLFAFCSLFSTRWVGTGDLEGVRDVDEHFGEPALLQRVEKSFRISALSSSSSQNGGCSSVTPRSDSKKYF